MATTISWVEVFAGALAAITLFGCIIGRMLKKLDDSAIRYRRE